MENITSIANRPVKKDIINNNFRSSQRTKTPVGNLDKDAFLKLLVTELRHQDPTQPMENKEFIAQMAQFSAVEQMTNVNKSIQQLNRTSRSGEAYSLLGKNVKAFNPTSGVKIEGIVTSVFYKNEDIRLIVNGKEIGLNDVHTVYTNDTVKNSGHKISENNVKSNNTSKDNTNINDTIKTGK